MVVEPVIAGDIEAEERGITRLMVALLELEGWSVEPQGDGGRTAVTLRSIADPETSMVRHGWGPNVAAAVLDAYVRVVRERTT